VVPESADSSERHLYYVFVYMYNTMMKFNWYIRHSKRLIRATNIKIEHLSQYTLIKGILNSQIVLFLEFLFGIFGLNWLSATEAVESETTAKWSTVADLCCLCSAG
jgi:hypothetical protein